MMITVTQIQQLREETGAGVIDCKAALEQAMGDLTKAKEILRAKGISSAAKKSGRSAKEGAIGHYLHMGGRIGVLVEVNCETDFVARNESFQQLTKEVAMQVAATSPRWVNRDEVPQDVVKQQDQSAIEKFYERECLLDQYHIRDTSGKTKISSLIQEAITKLGENIVIRRFVRMQVGEE